MTTIATVQTPLKLPAYVDRVTYAIVLNQTGSHQWDLSRHSRTGGRSYMGRIQFSTDTDCWYVVNVERQPHDRLPFATWEAALAEVESTIAARNRANRG